MIKEVQSNDYKIYLGNIANKILTHKIDKSNKNETTVTVHVAQIIDKDKHPVAEMAGMVVLGQRYNDADLASADPQLSELLNTIFDQMNIPESKFKKYKITYKVVGNSLTVKDKETIHGAIEKK